MRSRAHFYGYRGRTTGQSGREQIQQVWRTFRAQDSSLWDDY